jgi:hypothetical protein
MDVVPAYPRWHPLCAFCFLAAKIGTELQSWLTGPVNVWNTTYGNPTAQDLTGYYQISHKSDLQKRRIFASENSGFRLTADYKLEVVDLPAFDIQGNPRDCHFNGTGSWSVPVGSGDKVLNININTVVPALPGNLPSCGPDNFASFQMLGHSTPYHFWYYIGDPDEDEGLTYRRR